MNAITKFIDDYLAKSGRTQIGPVEANVLLAKAGILKDSKDRPGKPLRDLLRKGQLPHAFQAAGKGSSWTIPHSSNRKSSVSNYSFVKQQTKNTTTPKVIRTKKTTIDISKLKKQLETARQKYKPEKIKYLLIAEAAPDSLDRFFYYEDVRQHDYLFLGITQVLYPKLKEEYLSSGRSIQIKKYILQKLQQDGFYLLDLSELPISLLDSSLQSQLPKLVERINAVSEVNTQIILIKSNVYDIAFRYLKENIEKVIDQRIMFPAQGWQENFRKEFKQALKKVQYIK